MPAATSLANLSSLPVLLTTPTILVTHSSSSLSSSSSSSCKQRRAYAEMRKFNSRNRKEKLYSARESAVCPASLVPQHGALAGSRCEASWRECYGAVDTAAGCFRANFAPAGSSSQSADVKRRRHDVKTGGALARSRFTLDVLLVRLKSFTDASQSCSLFVCIAFMTGGPTQNTLPCGYLSSLPDF